MGGPPNNSLQPTTLSWRFLRCFCFVAFHVQFGLSAQAARRVSSVPLGSVSATVRFLKKVIRRIHRQFADRLLLNGLVGEMDFKAAAIEEWHNLEMYAEIRRQELSRTFESLVEAINAYEQLACRLVVALGQFAPSDSQDDALRDLFAEAFDSLHISKRLILKWLPSSTLALLRRAYEITSLFAYLVLNPAQIEKWQSGKTIRNQEIRRFLANHPMGEQEVHLRELYSILSAGTHVNREFTPHRQLGRGNQFTLGSISRPIMTIVGQDLIWLISIWFWVMALITYRYKEVLSTVDPGFGHDYMAVAKQAQDVVEGMKSQWDKLTAFDTSPAQEDAA